jgi:hypothetical protein
MVIAIVVVLGALIKKAVDALKPLGLTHALATQFVAWALGLVSTYVAVLAHAPGTAHLGFVAQAVLGLIAGSIASVIHDVTKAISAPPTIRS